MAGRVKTRLLEEVLDEQLVGQGLLGSSALGHQDEQGAGKVKAGHHRSSVVGVNVGDKGGLHLELVGCPCPLLQRQVHGPGPQVGATDADLCHRGEFFSGGIGNFT